MMSMHTRQVPVLRFLAALLCANAFALGQIQNVPPNAINPREVSQAHVDPEFIRLPVIDGTDIKFTRLSKEDGLSQTKVMQIVQDNQGFMWFGTQYGLNRYDGYSFKVFKHEPGRTNSLSGVYIYALFKDRSGSLWVGCGEFLDKFDPVTESFTHYRVAKGTEDEAVPVIHISQDHTGMLWLATSDGLYRLDPNTGQTIRYAHDPTNPLSLSSSEIKCTYEDKKGTFWVASTAGVDVFDRTAGKVTLHIPLYEPGEMSLYEDSTGVLWITHYSGEGIAVFDRKTTTLTHYSFHSKRVAAFGPTGVMTMLEDRHGTLWFGTHSDGLLKFDRKGRKFIRYHNEPGNPDSLTEDSLFQLFEDREGNIWASLRLMAPVRFTTRPPLFEKFEREPGNPNSLSHTMTDAIYEDRAGTLWIGYDDALSRIDRKTGRYNFYRTEGPVPIGEAISIIEGQAGVLWVGTHGYGLKRFDYRRGLLKTFRHSLADRFSLSNDKVTRLLVDHAGTLWATTFDGLDRFDSANSRFTAYKPDKQRAAAYIELKEDRQGALWMGTLFAGLQRFDPTTGQFTVYRRNSNDSNSLSDNRVNSVHFDQSGAMWVGTQNGLDRFDPETHSFAAFYERDGLPGNVVSCILEDKRGTLWMSTNHGLSAFDPLRKTFKNYSTGDGLPGDDLTGWGACYKSASGEMFFGGFSGGVAFFPDKVADASYTPPIVLTDFRLFANPVSIGGKSPLQRSISYTSSIDLSYRQNIFSIEFSALSYADPATNRYRYKLEGLQTEWNEASSRNRTVNYTTLPPGDYRFRVQGGQNRGPWNEPGVTLGIKVLPPLWGTRWFQTLCAASILVLLWALYRYRLYQFKHEFNTRLEERVSERSRIARDLHDTLLQSFQGLVLRFQAVRNQLPNRPEKACEVLDSALISADQAIAEGRSAIQELRSGSSQESNLEQMLLAMGRELASSQNGGDSAPSLRVIVEGNRRAKRAMMREEIYRIARELVRNAYRHARARNIEAELRYDDDAFLLIVRDDGKGIDPKVLKDHGRAGHWGLPGMYERAEGIGARLDIWSETGAGTEVRLTVPGAIAYEKSRDGGRFKLFRKMRIYEHRS